MGISIVIADDHQIMRQGLQAVLEADDQLVVVGEASNGRDTVNLVRKIEPDIVVMDITMPDLNGIDATKRIVDLFGTTRVLGLSAYSDEHRVRNMLQAGASGYLLKECAAQEIIQAIYAIHGGQKYISPSIMGIVVNDFVSNRNGEVLPKPITLSSRERDVLQLIAEGYSTNAIADKLHIGIKTVESHRKRLMDKLDIRNVASLTKYAIREGITSADG